MPNIGETFGRQGSEDIQAILLATFFAMFGETIPQSFQPLFIAGLGVTLVLSLVVVAMRGYFD